MQDHCPTAFLTPAEVYLSFDFVGRHRALLLFGVACLHRVWDHLECQALRDATTETEAYARSASSLQNVIAAWERVAFSLHERWWLVNNGTWWCPCCYPDGEELTISTPNCFFPCTPALFATRLAIYCRRISADEAREAQEQRHLYNDIIGPPFWTPDALGPAANDLDVRQLVTALRRLAQPDPLGMLALADALEEAGCTDGEVLQHCRSDQPHSRGCWVLEELTGTMARPLVPPPRKKRPAPLIPINRKKITPPSRIGPSS